MMGTSKSHGSPKDYSKQPHGANKEPFETDESQSGFLWRKAANNLSRYLNGNGDIIAAVSSYSCAKVSDLNNEQCSLNVETLENLCKLLELKDYDSFANEFDDYSKTSLEVFVAELINSIASVGLFREDVAARKALAETLKQFSKNINSTDNFIEILFSKKQQIITNYIKNYIAEQLLTDMGIKIETNCPTAYSAINFENEIKSYISLINYEFECGTRNASESLIEILRMLEL